MIASAIKLNTIDIVSFAPQSTPILATSVSRQADVYSKPLKKAKW
jgi:hypothetical protein